VGIVLGTVIPFVAILITVAIFVYLCCIRKNKTNKKKQQQSPLPITNNNYNNNSVNGKPMSNVLYTRGEMFFFNLSFFFLLNRKHKHSFLFLIASTQQE
jgi:hypothetical protein